MVVRYFMRSSTSVGISSKYLVPLRPITRYSGSAAWKLHQTAIVGTLDVQDVGVGVLTLLDSLVVVGMTENRCMSVRRWMNE